jgi:hypothetical protein
VVTHLVNHSGIGAVQIEQDIAGILVVFIRVDVDVEFFAVADAQEFYGSGMEQFGWGSTAVVPARAGGSDGESSEPDTDREAAYSAVQRPIPRSCCKLTSTLGHSPVLKSEV